jgi:Fe2+ or Zn2+ uptake regulation protein
MKARSSTAEQLLKQFKLRVTGPRIVVLKALQQAQRATTAPDLVRRIGKRDTSVNAVTIYRTLTSFETCGLAHHHRSGLFSLCTMPEKAGHHGLLHCHDCGQVEEFYSQALCQIEHRIAASARFRVHRHLSEMLGTCQACSA